MIQLVLSVEYIDKGETYDIDVRQVSLTAVDGKRPMDEEVALTMLVLHGMHEALSDHYAEVYPVAHNPLMKDKLDALRSQISEPTATQVEDPETEKVLNIARHILGGTTGLIQ